MDGIAANKAAERCEGAPKVARICPKGKRKIGSSEAAIWPRSALAATKAIGDNRVGCATEGLRPGGC